MPRINDREDAIALIQVVKSMYADSGVDITKRIDRWLSKAGARALYDLSIERVSQLAQAMYEAYMTERLDLPILSIAARQGLAGLTPIEWITLAQEVSPSDRDLFLDSLGVSSAVKQELLGFAGIWQEEKAA